MEAGSVGLLVLFLFIVTLAGVKSAVPLKGDSRHTSDNRKVGPLSEAEALERVFVALNRATVKREVENSSISSIEKLPEIAKSPNDDRQYRGLLLLNKLKVVLISDSGTEKSAAALDANVGHLNDPENIAGIAHFCEHMLFLGTKKYPSESGEGKYFSEHGGSYSARTTPDHTQYFFEIGPDHLLGALDRFAQMFISPLFTESAAGREVNAVNSEYEKNTGMDEWRVDQVERSTLKEGHPFLKDGCGTKQTLEGTDTNRTDVRTQLVNFYNTWYSANTMTLAVLGRESLDELEAMVAPLFSEVSNKNVTPPEWLDHPIGPEQMRVQLYVVPIEDINTLHVVFPIPDYRKYYKASTSHYLVHLLSHEGPGSLVSALKKRGWGSSLTVSAETPAKGFGMFTVKVMLTVGGLDHTADIVSLIFQYLNMLRKIGPQEWIVAEIRQLTTAALKFKSKEKPREYVDTIASSMHLYSVEDVLLAQYLRTEWKPDLINEILDLLTPSRVRITAVSQSFESIANLREKLSGAKYELEVIDDAIVKKWENCGTTDEFQFPKHNEFIPDNFDILPLDDQVAKHPVILYSSEIIRMWMKQDDVFFLPRASVRLMMYSPLAYTDPLNHALTTLFTLMVADNLKEFTYDATMADLHYGISSSKNGIDLQISGYNDKLHVLFEKIIDKITNFVVNEERFKLLKEEEIRKSKNFDTQPPLVHGESFLNSLLAERHWTDTDLLSVQNFVSPQALRDFVPLLLGRVFVEGLSFGNINKQQSLAIVELLEKKLSAKGPIIPLKPEQLILHRGVELSEGSNVLYEATTKVHKESSIQVYLQCGLRNRMELKLLHHIIDEPSYSILRTREQLGYIVWASVHKKSGVQGLNFEIQSDRHPKYLDQRIEAFLLYSRELLVNMTDEEYERHRNTVEALLLKKHQSLGEQERVFLREIARQEYDFNRGERNVAHLRTITKEKLLNYFDQYIAHQAPNRRKLSVYVTSVAEGGAGTLNETIAMETPQDCQQAPALDQPTIIEDVATFKRSHGLCSLPLSHIRFNQTKTNI